MARFPFAGARVDVDLDLRSCFGQGLASQCALTLWPSPRVVAGREVVRGEWERGG
jgi:hypothetical protein